MGAASRSIVLRSVKEWFRRVHNALRRAMSRPRVGLALPGGCARHSASACYACSQAGDSIDMVGTSVGR